MNPRRTWTLPLRIAGIHVGLLALYWLGHGLYCSSHPFPLPPALGSLRIALLAFPFAQALLLGGAWTLARVGAAEAIIEG